MAEGRFDSGGVGSEGMWDALRNIIATRKKDELLAQAEADRQQQFRMQEAQQRNTEKWQQLQYEGLQDERKRQNEDRDLTRKDRETAAALAAQDRADTATRTELGSLPIGYQAGAIDVAKADRVGMRGLFKPNAIDPANPDAPQTFKFAGTRDAQQDAAAAEDRKQAAIDSANLRRQLAAMAANKTPPAYYNALPSTASPTGVVLVDARTGTVKFPEMPAGSEAGLLGPFARDAAKAAQPVTQFINSLDTLQAVGDKHNWQGLGIPQGIQGWAARKGLTTPPPGLIEMQAAVEDVRSFAAHQRYGSALTEGEKSMLNRFVADAYTPGKITAQMVEAVKNIELGVLQRTKEGPFAPLNRPQGTGGMVPQGAPAPDPTDPYGTLHLFDRKK